MDGSAAVAVDHSQAAHNYWLHQQALIQHYQHQVRVASLQAAAPPPAPAGPPPPNHAALGYLPMRSTVPEAMLSQLRYPPPAPHLRPPAPAPAPTLSHPHSPHPHSPHPLSPHPQHHQPPAGYYLYPPGVYDARPSDAPSA